MKILTIRSKLLLHSSCLWLLNLIFQNNVIERILKVIKTFLPIRNKLPTTLTSILKLFDAAPVTSSKFFCNLCLKLCTLRSVCKLCQSDIYLLNKQLTELHTFDLREHRTYTTLNTCLFDEPDKAGECSRISSDKDDDNESSYDEEQETVKSTDDHILSREIPVKRYQVNDTSSSTVNQEKLVVNQSSSAPIKEMNYNLGQLPKQIAGLAHPYEQHQKTLNLILDDQKKIAKAMRNHKIPIVLFDETERKPSTSTIDSSTITCKSTTGEQAQLLQIPVDKANPNKFVLKTVDRILKQGKELFDPPSIDTDDRIKAILDSVQVKFGLTNDELATVWMPMLDCIKFKRRNLNAKLRNTTTSSSFFLGNC
ncbi:unnamed protein product [Rotaria sp. Silwood2]|nr:unnamed protein product [Rotaria sp. Silwood2]CAF4099375.1 unnamed protein product [Rotaria sp. Silwood2]CAF4466718.1 unnamed protein product [Rotaria sp. Silwood2]